MSEPVNWSLLELCLRAETCKEEMRYVPQSCVLLFLGVLMLEIIAHHYGNANPALKIQQRAEEEVSANSTDEGLRGLGESCEWSDDCQPHLCCRDFENGSISCQDRPNKEGDHCSVKVSLTPVEDEIIYKGPCPCQKGLSCDVGSDGNGQQRDERGTDGTGNFNKRGTCKNESTTPNGIQDIF
uniref:Ixodegrin B n=1 Tax=Rhipicephalus appendiculatus TaxID=34631 RepID=A0A131Z4P8_RHIAP